MQVGANLGPRLNRVSGIAPGWRRTPGLLGWLRQIERAHRLVALEAAGGQHHGAPRPDLHLLPLVLDGNAAHSLAVELQSAQRGIQPYRDIALAQRCPQTAHQRLAAGQPAVTLGTAAPWVVDCIPQHDPDDQQLGLALTRKDRVRLEGIDVHAAQNELAGIGRA